MFFFLSPSAFLHQKNSFKWLAMAPSAPKSGIAAGLNRGHVVTKRELPARPSASKGVTKTPLLFFSPFLFVIPFFFSHLRALLRSQFVCFCLKISPYFMLSLLVYILRSSKELRFSIVYATFLREILYVSKWFSPRICFLSSVLSICLSAHGLSSFKRLETTLSQF